MKKKITKEQLRILLEQAKDNKKKQLERQAILKKETQSFLYGK